MGSWITLQSANKDQVLTEVLRIRGKLQLVKKRLIQGPKPKSLMKAMAAEVGC